MPGTVSRYALCFAGSSSVRWGWKPLYSTTARGRCSSLRWSGGYSYSIFLKAFTATICFTCLQDGLEKRFIPENEGLLSGCRADVSDLRG